MNTKCCSEQTTKISAVHFGDPGRSKRGGPVPVGGCCREPQASTKLQEKLAILEALGEKRQKPAWKGHPVVVFLCFGCWLGGFETKTQQAGHLVVWCFLLVSWFFGEKQRHLPGSFVKVFSAEHLHQRTETRNFLQWNALEWPLLRPINIFLLPDVFGSIFLECFNCWLLSAIPPAGNRRRKVSKRSGGKSIKRRHFLWGCSSGFSYLRVFLKESFLWECFYLRVFRLGPSKKPYSFVLTSLPLGKYEDIFVKASNHQTRVWVCFILGHALRRESDIFGDELAFYFPLPSVSASQTTQL